MTKRLLTLVGWCLAATCAVASPADYDRGYRDGYHDREARDRERNNKDYREGYKDGEAHRRAGGRSGGDYDKGYRDGYRGESLSSRERENKNYMRGYRAGQQASREGSGRPLPGVIGGKRGDYKKLAGKPLKDLAPWMQRYGYRKTSESKSDLEVMTQWCRGQERPCLQSTVRDNLIMSVHEVNN